MPLPARKPLLGARPRHVPSAEEQGGSSFDGHKSQVAVSAAHIGEAPTELSLAAMSGSSEECCNESAKKDAIMHASTPDTQELRLEAPQVPQMPQVSANQGPNCAGDVGDWRRRSGRKPQGESCGDQRGYERRKHDAYPADRPGRKIAANRYDGYGYREGEKWTPRKKIQAHGNGNQGATHIDGDDLLTDYRWPVKDQAERKTRVSPD